MKSAFLLFPVLVLCAVARAESPDSIPDPSKARGSITRSWVYDGARVLDVNQRRHIDDAINALEKKTGAQILVVTVQTLDGIPIEEYANSVFRRISVGNKDKDDGAMFLFAIKDRKWRAEVGPGLQDRLTDARAGAIMRDSVPSAFRRGDYGGGVLTAVQNASNIIQGGGRPTPQREVPQSAPPAGVVSPSSSGNDGSSEFPSDGDGVPTGNGFPSGGSYRVYPATAPSSGDSSGGLLLLGLLAAGGIGAMMYLGSRPRKCPRCQTEMQETEAASSELSPANQCEQAIGSRHFVRYGCAKCGFSQIEPRNVAFSRFTQCSACHNLTAQRISRALQQPTYSHVGLEETTEQCLFPPCRHIWRRQRTLPRLQRSSSGAVIIGSGIGGFAGGLGSGSDDSGSSGGGSYDGGAGGFGGGDSDGGGASGGW